MIWHIFPLIGIAIAIPISIFQWGRKDSASYGEVLFWQIVVLLWVLGDIFK